MYKSVEEFFVEEFPFLMGSLNNNGAFWPRVKDNTISNQELGKCVTLNLKVGNLNSAVFLASAALIAARVTKRLPTPGRPTS